MNIVICDDELEEVEKTYGIVQKICNQHCPEAELRGFTNYQEFLAYIKRVHVDIAFLDIYMGSNNGIDAAKTLRQTNDSCAIIFVTSSKDHAISAFDVQASHYIVKPLNEEKVKEALTRTKLFSKKKKMIGITSDYINIALPLEKILYVLAKDNSTVFYLKNNTIRKTHTSLQKISVMLADDHEFISCHRNIIINANYVKDFSEKEIEMIDGFSFIIPQKRYATVKSQYMDYIFSALRDENQ